MNIFACKKQIKLNLIIILVISLLFIFSFNVLAGIEVYFSPYKNPPYDNPELIIVKNIDNAKKSINIAMYSLTEGEISNAIIRAKDK
jgi:phosphatidylserine/phosphatidylglycerophosphate/cardiolipin synthase-like enzyme